MSKLIRVVPALAIVLMSACSGDSQAKPAAGATPAVRARGAAAGLKIVWAVEAVDLQKRVLTLRGPGGKTAAFNAGPEVKRLSEIHAGDSILAEYQVSAVAELREPTAEEDKGAVVVAEMLDRRPSNLPPGGTLARTVRVVITVESVNATAGTVTMKGPLEGVVTAKAEDPAALSNLKAGQKIVATFDETLILSVEPAPKK